MHRHRIAFIMAFAFALARPAAAASIGPNYDFPDGSPAFSLQAALAPEAPAGLLNPGLLVGFNPQPDPPGIPPTMLAWENPTTFVLSNGFASPGGVTYRIYLSFLGIGSASMPDINAYPPGPCRADIDCAPGFAGTGFSFDTTIGGQSHEFDVLLGFTGGGGFNGSWVSFNPQPDPPGDGVFVDMGFNGVGDPNMSVTVLEDGIPLAFNTPEPATLSLLGIGFSGLLLMRRRG
jgi:hypothetical protein